MNNPNDVASFETVGWVGDAATGFVRMIDQTLLPVEFLQLECRNIPTVWEAIKALRVRGAPAIGVAAGFGAVVGGQKSLAESGDLPVVRAAVQEATDHLRTSRPTAVNLFWALDRMESRRGRLDRDHRPGVPGRAARRGPGHRHRRQGDVPRHRPIRGLLDRRRAGVLTHCNAGGLATADYGTALAVIFAAVEDGTALRVYSDETRPLLQGARLTAWELQRRTSPSP